MKKHLHRSLFLTAALGALTMSAAGTASDENVSGTSAPSPEDVAAAQKAEKAKLEKEAKEAAKKEKAEKATAEKADKKAKADAEKKEKADKAAADKQAKLDAKAADAKKKADDKAAKEKAALDAKAAKEANKMPEQNGVRRPKADGKCGQAWGFMDSESKRLGSPVPIATLLIATNAAKLNEGNVRAEYARWRKFNGYSGRIVAAPAAAPASDAAPAQ